MRHRAIALLLAAAAALSGCQNSAQRPSPTAEPKVVRVFCGESTSDAGLEDIFTERLAQHFPDVRLDWESVDWGERFSSTLQMKIAAGEMPDLIIGKAQDVRAFLPNLAPLSDALSARVEPFGLEMVSMDGITYGLPYNMLYQGVVYNKNIFYRYGLSEPTTTEELRFIVERLEEIGITPFGTHFQEVWYTGNIMMQFAANEIFATDPDWGDRLRRGEASFADSPGWRYCYEQAAYVLSHSWPDALTISQHEADKRFAAEECAMYLTGSWSIQTLLTIAPQRKLGIFPYPNQAGDAKLIYEPNITFMISAGSKERDLVEQMLSKLVNDPELAERVFQFTQTDSMLKGAEPGTLQILRDSIDRHRSENNMLDVTIGNSQLVWQYQYHCAEATLAWLKGQGTLTDALAYADEHRAESGAESH